MKRSELFHLFTKASTRYQAALHGWKVESYSGWKAVKHAFDSNGTTKIKGKVKSAKRVPSLSLLRQARDAAEAAYLSKQRRSLQTINAEIARLNTKASKVEGRKSTRHNRLRVLVLEDQISLLQKEAGLTAPSTAATLSGVSGKTSAKASKKALKKAKKNKTSVTLVAFGSLEPERITDPRDFDFASFDPDEVETAYRYFLASAVQRDDKPEKSYWAARLFTCQNPSISSQRDVLEAWKATVDVHEYVLMEARSGIHAEFDLRRRIGARNNSGAATAGARS